MNVVSLGDFRVTHKTQRRYPKPECAHKNFELDDNGDLVMCLDCGKQISAYFALRMITEDWGRVQAGIESKAARVAEEKDKHIHLLAAREVERAWRSRHMVPTCPHCSEGISAEDRFGCGAGVSKQIDQARRTQRARLKAAQAEPAPKEAP